MIIMRPNLKRIFIYILFLFIFVACNSGNTIFIRDGEPVPGPGDDDNGGDTPPAESGELNFGNRSYDLSWGYIQSFGSNEDFTNYDFYLYENVIDLTGSMFNSDFELYLELFALGDTFGNGRYSFSNSGSANYFDYAYIQFYDTDEGYQAVGGYVDVNRSGDNWTLDISLELEGGNSLSASISYPFEVYGEDGEEEDDEIINAGDNQTSTRGEFYIDGVYFPIEVAVVQDYGNYYGNGLMYGFYLQSRDFDGGNPGYHYINLDLFSSGTDEFVNGDYHYSSDLLEEVNHFGGSTNFIATNNGLNEYFYTSANNGTITVNISNGNLLMEFYFEDAANRQITGIYDAPFTFYGTGDKNIFHRTTSAKPYVMQSGYKVSR